VFDQTDAIRARLTLAFACGALLLGGCGGGGGGGAATAPVPTPSPTPAPLPGSFADAVAYSDGASASLVAGTEGAAVVALRITLAGKTLDYTATTGHLTAIDARSGQPAASFFYVAYTAGTLDAAQRPLTFFYNGGPGSASLWLHLGSFGPKRIVTGIAGSSMPNPPQLVENQETLLDHSDLVFVDAIGTGFSQAIAPKTNQDFWGVDSDAAAFRDFVQRYVAKNQRQASPKFLYGESYGAPRTGVLANLLEVAGVRLSGVVLQSAIMNYNANCGVMNPGTLSCEGYIPSYAAVSAYYLRSNPLPTDFIAYLQQARDFSAAQYAPAVSTFLLANTPPPASVVAQLVDFTGLPATLWTSNLAMGPDLYRANLLSGKMIGRYDARVNAASGSALTVDGDPSLTLIEPTFDATIRNYITDELRYTARSTYAASTDLINRWNFSHDGKPVPDTIPDLAAAITINPALKVVAMGGYYDLVTPYHQTELDLQRLGPNPNLQIRNYGSGHMSYLDDSVRSAQRADMVNLYNSVSVAK
jgi:carboxypeptidase C (cathepsin A)